MMNDYESLVLEQDTTDYYSVLFFGLGVGFASGVAFAGLLAYGYWTVISA